MEPRSCGSTRPPRSPTTSRAYSPPGRRSYIPARLLREQGGGEYLAQPIGGSGRHMLSTLAQVNALALVPEAVSELTVGEQIELLPRGRA